MLCDPLWEQVYGVMIIIRSCTARKFDCVYMLCDSFSNRFRVKVFRHGWILTMNMDSTILLFPNGGKIVITFQLKW